MTRQGAGSIVSVHFVTAGFLYRFDYTHTHNVLLSHTPLPCSSFMGHSHPLNHPGQHCICSFPAIASTSRGWPRQRMWLNGLFSPKKGQRDQRVGRRRGMLCSIASRSTMAREKEVWNSCTVDRPNYSPSPPSPSSSPISQFSSSSLFHEHVHTHKRRFTIHSAIKLCFNWVETPNGSVSLLLFFHPYL